MYYSYVYNAAIDNVNVDVAARVLGPVRTYVQQRVVAFIAAAALQSRCVMREVLTSHLQPSSVAYVRTLRVPHSQLAPFPCHTSSIAHRARLYDPNSTAGQDARSRKRPYMTLSRHNKTQKNNLTHVVTYNTDVSSFGSSPSKALHERNTYQHQPPHSFSRMQSASGGAGHRGKDRGMVTHHAQPVA